MKQINVGGWRIAFILMAVISLVATILTESVIPLAFVVVFTGVYLGFELFIIFNIVYSLSQFINQQIAMQQQMQQKQSKLVGTHNPDKVLVEVEPLK